IGLSDEIARSNACCSLLPASNAIEATSNAGITALTCWVAAALLPAPPPGESIGDAPGPPGPPTGDFGMAGGGPPGEDDPGGWGGEPASSGTMLARPKSFQGRNELQLIGLFRSRRQLRHEKP